ncbi:hypothetical protein SUGI_0634240 [Cryptomeria japonica]|uniref:uncharacterized protein LOC131051084 n=1 Tax=Cryptomeria japonica TaxID=3369 RepID=UPI002414910A|nr:uncharacterized protein LOC131051084 [Cryptomeria japonica]GLJ31599.1 hypothetical protein SUGI_0634240 [Cryptomeria japonica]
MAVTKLEREGAYAEKRCRDELAALDRQKAATCTMIQHLQELVGLFESRLNILDQMKTSHASSYYNDLVLRNIELEKQEMVGRRNFCRAIEEFERIRRETEVPTYSYLPPAIVLTGLQD